MSDRLATYEWAQNTLYSGLSIPSGETKKVMTVLNLMDKNLYNFWLDWGGLSHLTPLDV